MGVTRTITEPKPNASEQKALERLSSGQGSPADAETVRPLIDRCGRHGCVYTRPSSTSPGMKECPGWCDALDVYEEQRKAQAAAISGDTESKAGKLARDEKAAVRAYENGDVSTKDTLILMLLAEKCAKSGCANTDNAEVLCPGWCSVARKAWDAWWSR